MNNNTQHVIKNLIYINCNVLCSDAKNIHQDFLNFKICVDSSILYPLISYVLLFNYTTLSILMLYIIFPLFCHIQDICVVTYNCVGSAATSVFSISCYRLVRFGRINLTHKCGI